MKRRAILLDRDGTVCEEVGYLDDVERVRVLPGSARAIALLSAAGFQTVLVTNQSGVARGKFSESLIGEVHERLRVLLAAEGARLDGVYYCPHHPQGEVQSYRTDCDCRKPRPGMLLRARDEMGIDLASSYLVGDHLRDVEAGLRVGATPILVRTGFGEQQLADRKAVSRTPPEHVAADLLEASRWILQREQERSE